MPAQAASYGDAKTRKAEGDAREHSLPSVRLDQLSAKHRLALRTRFSLDHCCASKLKYQGTSWWLLEEDIAATGRSPAEVDKRFQSRSQS